MANIKFTQLPDQGVPTDATIIPTVDSGTNYTVTGANLKTYVNSTTGNITGGNVNTTGNVTAGYFIGDGSLLTGLPATYGNANVSNYLASGTNSANIVTQANVAGAYVIADGSALSNLTGANIAGTISVAGNITGAYLTGNIRNATGGYGNANVQLVLQTYSGTLTAASLSTTGNISGQNFIGNGSGLTGVSASLGGTMVSNIAGAGYSITGLGTLTATGNISGGNISGNLTGSGANLTGIPTSIIAGTGISVNAATGAVTITNNNPTPYTNTNVAAFLPTYTGNLTAGNISVSGSVTGTHLGNGAGLSNIVTSIVAGSGITVNASTGAVTITSTGGTGNISGNLGGNLNTLNYTISSSTGPVLLSDDVTVGGNLQVGNGYIYSSLSNNNTMSAVGNCILSTAQLEFGTASAYLNGTTNTFIQCASNSNFAMGTGDFTVEMWIRPTATPVTGYLYDSGSVGSAYDYRPQLQIAAGQIIYSGYNYTNQIVGNVTITANTWNMVAVARSGTSTKLFWNGTQVGSTFTDTQNYNDSGGNVRIGATTYDAVPAGLTAATYIDEIRVSKGIARYTANFTPPTSPFTTDSYTSLLLHCDGTNGSTVILDSSSNNNIITVTGNLVASGSITSSGTLSGGNVLIPVATKTGTSTGILGQIAVDASYIYVCTSTNVWKRVALTAF